MTGVQTCALPIYGSYESASKKDDVQAQFAVEHRNHFAILNANTTYLVAMKRRMANNESAYQLKGVRKDYGEAQRPKTV